MKWVKSRFRQVAWNSAKARWVSWPFLRLLPSFLIGLCEHCLQVGPPQLFASGQPCWYSVQLWSRESSIPMTQRVSQTTCSTLRGSLGRQLWPERIYLPFHFQILLSLAQGPPPAQSSADWGRGKAVLGLFSPWNNFQPAPAEPQNHSKCCLEKSCPDITLRQHLKPHLSEHKERAPG